MQIPRRGNLKFRNISAISREHKELKFSENSVLVTARIVRCGAYVQAQFFNLQKQT